MLQRYHYLHYFQGFHDICQVFLLVLGLEKAESCVPRLCLTRIRDFMLPSLTPALSHLMLLPDIIQAQDSRLGKHLSHTQPFFALSATLTLYAHDIQAYGDIARLFDVFLAREPMFSLYLFATVRTAGLSTLSRSLTVLADCTRPKIRVARHSTR